MGFTEFMARNLRKPGTGLAGWFISKILKSRNSIVVYHAVRACNIERHHHVLEIGFGPGLGMASVAEIIRSGTGKVYGIDFSQSMVDETTGRLSEDIKQGKADVRLGDVVSLPFQDASMDRIFHTNCYYFWPDMNAASKELYRVLKPGGMMVTVYILEKLVAADNRGFLSHGDWRPERYMQGLTEVGFLDVERKSELGEDKTTTFEDK
ncbi:uncharacterized methyltransferase YdaC-like isoform X2 [Anneissia japonica]|uniref:uncharacterized methyltransferase YdaC-like isoform X2 n=1 Tax=Anneissia japonica TaxID=1529436 RepID=UPI0014256808|nr:uncharacterized methyltransferase YdaC-like isoform X2 [Anneissia japonica]